MRPRRSGFKRIGQLYFPAGEVDCCVLFLIQLAHRSLTVNCSCFSSSISIVLTFYHASGGSLCTALLYCLCPMPVQTFHCPDTTLPTSHVSNQSVFRHWRLSYTLRKTHTHTHPSLSLSSQLSPCGPADQSPTFLFAPRLTFGMCSLTFIL